MWNNKRVLITRYGGLGDTIMLTVVAKELNERGATVDYGVAFDIQGDYSNLINNLPFINSVKKMRRMGDWQMVQLEDQLAWLTTNAIRPFYDYVIDYKNLIEDNGHYRFLEGRYGGWIKTQNSNYSNWYDLALSWANIDSKNVERKYPYYIIKNEEKEWAEKTLKHFKEDKIIGINVESSSLPRSWYYDEELEEEIHKRNSDFTILRYSEGFWILKSKRSSFTIPIKNDIRKSIALMDQCDIVICTDSSMAHFCDAIEKKCIVIYTTVPAWTRMGYSHNIIPIEPQKELECRPCFIIGGWCPERAKQTKEMLTERDRSIIECADPAKGLTITQVAKMFNQNEQAIVEEAKAINHSMMMKARTRPECIESISCEYIVNKLMENL